MPTLARAPQQQLHLFHHPPTFTITSNAHARNAYGQLAQEIACAALDLQPIPIDGRCSVCFDAEDSNGQFYEIKSVHRTGKVVIYDWRIDKEAAYPSLTYILVVHNARGCCTAAAMLSAYHNSLELWLVPAHRIHAAAKEQPLCLLKRPSIDPRNGYSRAGYVRGYRNVPLTALRPSSRKTTHFNLYGSAWTAQVLS